MKKTTLLLAVAITLSSTYAHSSCDLNYYKKYVSEEIEFKLQVLPSKKINEIFKKIKLMKSNKDKIDGLEEVYNFLFGYYRTKNQQLNALVEASQGKLPAEYLKQAKRQLEIDGMREITTHNNRLIEDLASVMRKSGVPVEVKMRTVLGDFEFKFLVLDASVESSSRSIQTIQRYQKRFGTKEVTFDLLENTKNGSAGFSQQWTKRIDLGMRGIRNIILDDLITMVGKHEFYHAAFSNMRDKGLRSIYHPQYFATGTAPISTVKNHYNMYMSAEELYNWTNNSFWASERMKDITKFGVEDVLNDFYGISNYLGGTTKIAQQTKEVATNFAKFAKNVQQKQLAESKFYLEVLDKNFGTPQKIEDAFSVNLARPDGVVMNFYIDERIRPTINKLLEKRLKLTPEYDALFTKFKDDPKKIAELTNEYLQKEMHGLEREMADVFEVIAQDQITLARVADIVEKESYVVTKKSSDMLKELKAIEKMIEENPAILREAYWVQKFEDMALEYRRFGNIVKENYKGFAGN